MVKRFALCLPDMIKRRNLRTRAIKMLVLDEADEMLNKGRLAWRCTHINTDNCPAATVCGLKTVQLEALGTVGIYQVVQVWLDFCCCWYLYVRYTDALM